MINGLPFELKPDERTTVPLYVQLSQKIAQATAQALSQYVTDIWPCRSTVSGCVLLIYTTVRFRR